jgi:hypothetical protein
MRTILKSTFTLIAALLLSGNTFAQKVANYAFGKYGTPEYEHFSFWTKAGKRAEITYAYGKIIQNLMRGT